MPRPTKLLIVPLLLIALASPPATAQPISGAEAIDAMKEVMRARGMTPPPESGLSLDDYIQTSLDESGSRNVRLWIGPDGHIIPSPEWQTYHPTYCMQRARYMESAANVLNFKASRNTEELDGLERTQTFTFVQFIDAGTLVIEEQREGEEGPDPDSRGLVATMSDAWDQLTVPIGGLTGPCGEVRVRHVEGTDAGDEFVFLAGFQGTYGRYLNYTWDFGDGSAPVSGGKRARHVYDAEGTYEVSVRVEGDNIEPGTGTLTVDVGATELILVFSSRSEQREPDGYLQASRYEGTIPLTARDDSTYEGTAPVRNVEYVHTELENAPGGCRGVPRDGAFTARVEIPNRGGGSADGIEAFLVPPSDEATPRADVVCEGGMVVPGFADTWWGTFALLHAPEDGESYQFSEWEPAADPAVIARTVASASRTLEETTTVSVETTIEIRRGPPLP